MAKRQQTGRRGEAIAAGYFMRHGFRILDRNWRCEIGELDIVMEQEDTLIFVEVRTRRGHRYGTAEESITPGKQARLIELAHRYIQDMQPAHATWRIDVAAVQLVGSTAQVNHIENAVGW